MALSAVSTKDTHLSTNVLKLGDVPTAAEIKIAISKMANNKAPGKLVSLPT
jgi:hypothetical protein